VEEVLPPDDAGRDAYARFGYQAHIAFAYCLRCYCCDDVVSIHAEHFEDLMVTFTDRVRFVGIKTRDLELGPWTLNDLLNSGAFKSLLRTRRAIPSSDQRRFEFEIRLEGPLRRGNLIEGLLERPIPNTVVSKCAASLGIGADECRTFLEGVVLRPLEPVLVQKWVPLPEQGKHRKPTCRSYPGRTAIDGLPGRSYRGTTAILPSNSDPAFAQVTDGNGLLDQDALLSHPSPKSAAGRPDRLAGGHGRRRPTFGPVPFPIAEDL